jgi:serine protease Do
MASAMAVTGALLFAAPGGRLSLGPAPAIAQAQTVQAHGPAGFADVVQKVKPAVVSVRVKLKNQVSSSDSTSGDSKDQAPSFPKGSPFERFFRGFGWPNQPNAAAFHHGPGFRLFHISGRLCGNEQSRREQRRFGRDHDRCRKELHRQGDRVG